MSYTTDSSDPRLTEKDEQGMNEVYLVLSEEERAKGFVRPLREKSKLIADLISAT